MKSRLALLLTLAITLAGCGYHLGEIRPTPMRSVRTLAVPTFKNNTFESRIEVLFADTLVKKLQQDGTYRIVNTEQADAVVYCTIEKIERGSLRAVQNNVYATSEFRLTVLARYEVIDIGTGRVLMEGQVSGNTSFFSGNDLQTLERQGLSNAAADLAENLTTRLTEGW
ncbi:MAG: LPS assembly lipoprotein LptE [Spartobacteria bacterium]|jgi:outer membrane lipopolysaccharide assembly protein LptE/RlpB